MLLKIILVALVAVGGTVAVVTLRDRNMAATSVQAIVVTAAPPANRAATPAERKMLSTIPSLAPHPMGRMH